MLRPRPRPEGLMTAFAALTPAEPQIDEGSVVELAGTIAPSVLRPRARPDDLETAVVRVEPGKPKRKQWSLFKAAAVRTQPGNESILPKKGSVCGDPAIRGEVMGFDALCMERYPTAVSALEESSVYVVLKRDVVALTQLVPSFGLSLQRAGSLTLTRSRELVELLAAVASEVKLARFLIQLSYRMAGCGQSPRRFHLRMGRREIASLLGVAHETVSRSFSTLAALGMVGVSDREVEILDIDGLKRFARSTRRHLDEPAVSRTRRPVAKRSASVHHAMAQPLAA